MTTTQNDTKSLDSGHGVGEILHWFCCDEDRAVCGKDVTGEVFVSDEDEDKYPLCVVCEDLWGEPCDNPECELRA